MIAANYTSHYRLDRPDAVQLIKDMNDRGVEECSEHADTTHRKAYQPPVVSTTPSEEDLAEIRSGVLSIAEDFGFPRRKQSKSATLSKFDVAVGDYLLEKMSIAPADAGLEETWNFITLVLLPDVASWRFTNSAKKPEYDRWIGTPRNVFRKAWWRSYVLGSELNATLGEDEGVGIMERPTFGMNPVLARSITTVHRDLNGRYAEKIGRSDLLRLFMVQLGKISSIVNLDAYTQEEAIEVFREIYLETANKVGSE